MKPNINSVKVHPQLSNNGHPMDGSLVTLELIPIYFSESEFLHKN
jgi:hypothetical protein